MAKNIGILEDSCCREFFKELNKRPHCDECWSKRSDFEKKDRKRHDSYSNLVPGFSSDKISIPIDVLIVGDSHGGGEEGDFRGQRGLDFEVSNMARFYQCLPDKTFHQHQVRLLLDKLDNVGMTWVFADLIKCFVWHHVDEKTSLDGRENRRIAMKHCEKYLDEQVKFLQPCKILGLGGTVAQKFNVDSPSHSASYHVKINGHSCVYVHSLFPAQWTADKWIEKDGWSPVLKKIVE
jgi:hypothetical protein